MLCNRKQRGRKNTISQPPISEKPRDGGVWPACVMCVFGYVDVLVDILGMKLCLREDVHSLPQQHCLLGLMIRPSRYQIKVDCRKVKGFVPKPASIRSEEEEREEKRNRKSDSIPHQSTTGPTRPRLRTFHLQEVPRAAKRLTKGSETLHQSQRQVPRKPPHRLRNASNSPDRPSTYQPQTLRPSPKCTDVRSRKNKTQAACPIGRTCTPSPSPMTQSMSATDTT